MSVLNITSDMGEERIRVAMMNQTLVTPHKDLDITRRLHEEMVAKDPLFYAHFAVWYDKHQEVRDHKQAFITHLITSEFSEHREAGCAMLESLPPFMVARTIRYLKEKIGKLPKIARTTVRDYLRKREKNSVMFDNAVARARKDMKYLYSSLRIKPSTRAQNILFKKDYPKDSILQHIKVLSKTEDPAEQAMLIHSYKIPYTTAVGAIKEMTKSVIVALVDTMTPQEIINNLNSLKKRGAMDDPQIKGLIEERIADAVDDERVSTMKGRVAAKVANVSKGVKNKLEDMVQKKVKKKGSIKRDIAIFIDKSPSMQAAIEVGKAVAAMVSSICVNMPYVYAFDCMPFKVYSKGRDIKDWEEALKMFRAGGGGTAIGAPFKIMMQENAVVEQIIVITDEEENGMPYFYSMYQKYVDKMNITPDVLIVFVKSSGASFCRHMLHKSLEQNNIMYDKYEFNGDYYSLPNLIPMIDKNSKFELLMEIMNTPLPVRERSRKKVAVAA